MGKKHKSSRNGSLQSKAKSGPMISKKNNGLKLSPQKRNDVNQLVDKLLKGKLLSW